MIPRRLRRPNLQRRHQESLCAQNLHLKGLVGLLNGLPNSDGMFQLLLPLGSNLVGFGVEDVSTAHTSVMVKRQGVDCASIRGRLWSWCVAIGTKVAKKASASLSWRVCVVDEREKVQGNRLRQMLEWDY